VTIDGKYGADGSGATSVDCFSSTLGDGVLTGAAGAAVGGVVGFGEFFLSKSTFGAEGTFGAYYFLISLTSALGVGLSTLLGVF
jgi:hypothetical protein